MLTYTTSPIALTDGLENLLEPLKKLHVPVHELAMMMCIALRFIPTLIEETDKIMSAQKARGADFESGNLIARAKAMVPILVPLFISAFRRADELATAMECRCYHGGEGRTRLNQLRYAGRDYVAYAFEFCEGSGGGVLSAAGTAAKGYYVMQEADTLWSVAQRYDLRMRELLAMNPEIANPNHVRAGQKVRIA